MTGGIDYRKLPGHRRGFLNGASLWLGPDHLLLVKSQRFREEYRRFYFRDIQAITIAQGNRFHFSTRAAFLAAIWLVLLIVSLNVSGMMLWLWVAALIAVGAWVFISLERSCYCRIFTAVSSDLLPSVYRTWTARRFLEAIEPRIREAQGEAPEGWVDTVEDRPVGPVAAAAPLAPAPDGETPEAFDPVTPLIPPTPSTGKSATLGGFLFAATLLLEFGLDLTMYFQAFSWMRWAFMGVLATQMIAAAIVFIERATGRLSPPLHRAAIGKIVWSGIGFYTNVVSVRYGVRQVTTTLMPASPILMGVDAAVSIVVLGIAAAMMTRGEPERPTSILGV